MSRRRRVLLAAVGVLALIAAVVAGLLLGPSGPPEVGPDTRPPPDALGPVLLVPGYGGSRDALLALAERIEASGRDADVLTLAGDGRADLSAQVEVLDEAADALVASGAPSVDVVGYSAGGVVVGLWVARGDGATQARRVVTLGAPLAGTTLAALGAAAAPDACPAACRQLAPGSAELAELARADVGRSLPWLSIWTADDRTVTPPESAQLPGVVDVAVQEVCPGAAVGHSALPRDPVVTGLVLTALGTGPLPTGGECAVLRALGTP
ncbi:MAG TPA: lipase [Pseudonocardia sp.]|nr:lipase [Pseudonocardia sp.]